MYSNMSQTNKVFIFLQRSSVLLQSVKKKKQTQVTSDAGAANEMEKPSQGGAIPQKQP